MQDGTQMELDRPVVDGDELVSRPIIRLDGDELVAPGVSMPLADILRLEVQASRRGRTALWAFAGLAVIFMTGVVPDLICGPEEAPNGRC